MSEKKPEITAQTRDGFEHMHTQTETPIEIGARARRLPTLAELELTAIDFDDPTFEREVRELLEQGDDEIFRGVDEELRRRILKHDRR